MRIGLLLGLLNEKNNQIIDFQNKEDKQEEIIQGDANMLMNM